MPMVTTGGDGLRRIPGPEWLRELLAEGEEHVFRTAGMRPPYWAPVGAERPPGYRVPLYMSLLVRYNAQGANQGTDWPEADESALRFKPQRVPTPFQVERVDLEPMLVPSGVNMTW
jgi:hypothetical protein